MSKSYSKNDILEIIDHEEKCGNIRMMSNMEKDIVCMEFDNQLNNSDAYFEVESQSDAAYAIADDILDDLLSSYANKKVI